MSFEHLTQTLCLRKQELMVGVTVERHQNAVCDISGLANLLGALDLSGADGIPQGRVDGDCTTALPRLFAEWPADLLGGYYVVSKSHFPLRKRCRSRGPKESQSPPPADGVFRKRGTHRLILVQPSALGAPCWPGVTVSVRYLAFMQRAVKG